MEKWVFVTFLFIAAAQDLRRKEVEIWVYLLFGGMGLAVGIARWVSGEAAYAWMEHLAASGIGIALLAASAVSRGEIGMGDGCFFLVSGLLLGFWENVILLSYGVLLCGMFCLGYFVWCRFHMAGDVRKRVVPFLPFLVPSGIWLALRGGRL